MMRMNRQEEVLNRMESEKQQRRILRIIFFFIELGTRRVHLAGVTTNPDSAWVVQQARQFVWQLEGNENDFRFLLHDHDSKFTTAFDNVFQSEGIHPILTPIKTPNANAYAERVVRTIREECLDHILILNQTHLKNVEYLA